MDVAEMRMLRWMMGVTRLDRIRSERIRRTVTVVEVSRKIQEERLQCYGHVMRENDRGPRGQESVGDGGSRKKEERMAKEMNRLHKRRLDRERIRVTGGKQQE